MIMMMIMIKYRNNYLNGNYQGTIVLPTRLVTL